MAELATIARPYAEALYQATASSADATLGWLDPLAAATADARLQEFASNPKVGSQQVFDLIAGLVPNGLPDAGRNFLVAVVENGRLAALPEVALQYRALHNASSGAADAVIQSAFPIDDAALSEVTGALERRFGRKLTARVEIDPALIGGIRAVVGDEVLDTSVKARLEQMKAALIA
ncbi:F0F1 ATP synthase subunit delta [Xenophilus arseniciresistens]|uniref:ATP synthase subunit delta n=1 Tax=Xenophilus arseniciresistens TaxID=1283306 RepID=A0AAE3ND46_9BURK|nr:F0F1 ATP synthase subunit delta [Xenophilus arseniciresistens]MDA7418854.1 F0F1 ATP synthase subunit delta [Xenophilus arseniciresistens]